jgi:hypothetical protein
MRVRCARCEKATYKGCGKHVEQVLRGVDESERCQCLAAAPPAEPPSLPEASLIAS